MKTKDTPQFLDIDFSAGFKPNWTNLTLPNLETPSLT